MAPTKSQNKGLDGGFTVKSDLRTAVVRFDIRFDVRLQRPTKEIHGKPRIMSIGVFMAVDISYP